MGQKSQLILGLKKILKTKDINYLELSKKIGMSHSNMRRMFSAEHMNLDHLDEICKALDVSFKDLCQAMEEEVRPVGQFSLEQEKALAKNQELFSLFYILATGLTLQEVIHRHHFEKRPLELLLLKLDKLGLIELHAGNRVKCLHGTDIKWNAGGPLEQKYKDQARREFWNADFEGSDERSSHLYSKLGPYSMAVVKRKFDRLLQEVEAMSNDDRKLYPKSQLLDMFFVVAYRPFVPSSINFLKKDFGLKTKTHSK